MALLDKLRDLHQEYDLLVRSEKHALSEPAFRRAFDTREALEQAIAELESKKTTYRDPGIRACMS